MLGKLFSVGFGDVCECVFSWWNLYMFRLLKVVIIILCSFIFDLIFECLGLVEVGFIFSKFLSVDI